MQAHLLLGPRPGAGSNHEEFLKVYPWTCHGVSAFDSEPGRCRALQPVSSRFGVDAGMAWCVFRGEPIYF